MTVLVESEQRVWQLASCQLVGHKLSRFKGQPSLCISFLGESDVTLCDPHNFLNSIPLGPPNLNYRFLKFRSQVQPE